MTWRAREARTPCRRRSPPVTRWPGRGADTDWQRIAALYDALTEISPSPVVDLNRAVAVSMAYGPAAGLEIVDRLIAVGELVGYHLVPSVRADLLFRLERFGEAREEFERAASLTLNESQRALLLERASACLDR